MSMYYSVPLWNNLVSPNIFFLLFKFALSYGPLARKLSFNTSFFPFDLVVNIWNKASHQWIKNTKT